jgi:hypothetical protein
MFVDLGDKISKTPGARAPGSLQAAVDLCSSLLAFVVQLGVFSLSSHPQ